MSLGPQCYVVMKRGLFYRPGSLGYTNDITKAGRYSFEDAKCEISPIDYPYSDRVTMHLLSEMENHPSLQIERLQRLVESRDAAIEELEADLEHTRRALEKEVAVSDLATNEAKEWQYRALKAERKLEFVERQQLGPSIEREKRLEQQNAKLMEALEEMYSAMLRYQSDAETEAPPAHRTMMYKAAQVLAEGGGK